MTEIAPQEVADGLIRLISEYADKMQQLLQRAEVIREKSPSAKGSNFIATPAGNALSSQFNRLQGGLADLIRSASQIADNGNINDLRRIELRIRLAELESLVHAAQTLIFS